jgi:hypothetical protein
LCAAADDGARRARIKRAPAAAWVGVHFGFATPEASKPSGAFPFDQRLKRLADKARLLFQASEGLRFGHKFVVERQCRAHHPASILGEDTLDDAVSNVAMDKFSSHRNEFRGAPRSRHLACIMGPRFERVEIEGME